MESFDAVINVKQRSHRSWSNIKNAVFKNMGLPYHFSTQKVASSSTSYLDTAIKESGMSAAEILHEIEQRGLA